MNRGTDDSIGRPTARWTRGWSFIALAIASLLGAALAAAVVALLLVRSIGTISDQALRGDVAIAEAASVVYADALRLKARHATLTVVGPTRAGISGHAEAVDQLSGAIDGLDAVVADSVAAGGAGPGPTDGLRQAVASYLSAVAPALEEPVDRATFDTALDAGLRPLADIEASAEAVNADARSRAAQARDQLEGEVDRASIVLGAILLAVTVAGLVVALLAVRVLRELRRLSSAEREATAAMGELLRTRADFIAETSHELRTPLTVVRGDAELGLRLEPTDDEHVPILRSIATESARMGRLVDDLLFLARHDAGAAPILRQPIELEVLAADIAARAEAICRQRDCTLDVDLRAAGAASLDPDRLEQAALILVDNATVHGPPGEPVTLTITARDSDELVIEVGDQGPGIPADLRPRVFERHVGTRDWAAGSGRAGTAQRAGLGLAIAQAIALEHGGSLEVAGQPGVSRMRLGVPLRQAGGEALKR